MHTGVEYLKAEEPELEFSKHMFHICILTLICSLHRATKLMERSQHIHFSLRDKVPNGSVIAKGKLLLCSELFPS